jgi:hypothetical protein
VSLALLRSISLDSGAKPSRGRRCAYRPCWERLSHSLSLLFRHDPDREHDNDDGDELQQHAKPHELLRCVARAPARHVNDTKEEHHRDGADGDRDCNVRHEIGHDRQPSFIDYDNVTRGIEY